MGAGLGGQAGSVSVITGQRRGAAAPPAPVL